MADSEKEIIDLLTSQRNEHPAMAEVSLQGPRYTHMVREQAALVVKSIRIGIIGGRLCVRGDTSPLTHVGFFS